MRLISDEEVAAVIDLCATTDALERAVTDLGRDRAASTIRVRASAGGTMASALAAAWPAGGVTGGKLYATKDGVFTFIVGLFDLEGRLIAVLEADTLTRVRTAAGTGVAIRRLLRAAPDVVTIIGTGRQCRFHLQLIANEVPRASEVRIVGRRPEPLERALVEAHESGLPAVAYTDAEAAVDGAGLIVTLTSSLTPLFAAERVSDEALICALGSTKRDKLEIGADVVGAARAVVVDSLEGSRTECGDLIAAELTNDFAWDDALELADVVVDPALLRRSPSRGLTLFEAQGIALQDIVAAALVVEAVDD